MSRAKPKPKAKAKPKARAKLLWIKTKRKRRAKTKYLGSDLASSVKASARIVSLKDFAEKVMSPIMKRQLAEIIGCDPRQITDKMLERYLKSIPERLS